MYYEPASTIALFLLFVVWSNDGFHNLLIKLMLASLAAWGGFETLLTFSYIIKV